MFRQQTPSGALAPSGRSMGSLDSLTAQILTPQIETLQTGSILLCHLASTPVFADPLVHAKNPVLKSSLGMLREGNQVGHGHDSTKPPQWQLHEHVLLEDHSWAGVLRIPIPQSVPPLHKVWGPIDEGQDVLQHNSMHSLGPQRLLLYPDRSRIHMHDWLVASKAPPRHPRSYQLMQLHLQLRLPQPR